jgi:hypothetical protein
MSVPRSTVNKNVLQKSTASNVIDSETTFDVDSSDSDGIWLAAKPAAKKIVGRRRQDATKSVKKTAKTSRATTKNQYATPPKSISIASSESITELEALDVESISSSIRSTAASAQSSLESCQLAEEGPNSTTLPESGSSSRPVRRGEGQKRLRRRVLSSSEGSSVEENREEQDVVLASLAKLSVESNPGENHLADALRVCDQSTPHNFATFIDTHRIASTSVKSKKQTAQVPANRNRFQKLGEASYSEVFGVYSASSSSLDEVPEAVMKVVPLALVLSDKPSRRSTTSSASHDDDGLLCLTEMQDIVKEIELTRLMNGIHDCFVNLRG